MNSPLDPRLNPFRKDLAAEALRGKVDAGRFAAGRVMQVNASVATVRAGPRFDAEQTTQALFGEHVTVYDEREGWAWGQLKNDGYVGYLPASDLAPESAVSTHRVAVPLSHFYPAPNMKTQPAEPVYLASPVAVEAEEETFSRLSDGRYIFSDHLCPTGSAIGTDPAGIAEMYLHVPYLWGGKTHAGLDCSGLVQLAQEASGRDCPRDTDMMQQSFGKALDGLERERLRRGDLVFWRGHVAMMLDGERMIHANAHHMRTVVEPLSVAVERIAGQGSGITAIRRP